MADASAEGLDVLVMASSNRRVDALNDAMQTRIVGARDPADELTIRWDDAGGGTAERTVGVGDLVRTRRNNYDLATTKGAPVVNGATWEVTHVRALPPPQTNRPTERRQIHQHSCPKALRAHPPTTGTTGRAGPAGTDHNLQW